MYILYSFVHYIRLPVGAYRPFQFSIQHRCQNQFTSAQTIIIIELDSSLAITNCDSKESRCRIGPNLISKRRWDNGWQNKCRKWKMARGRLSLDPTVGQCQANCAYLFCQLTAKIYFMFSLVLSFLVWYQYNFVPLCHRLAVKWHWLTSTSSSTSRSRSSSSYASLTKLRAYHHWSFDLVPNFDLCYNNCGNVYCLRMYNFSDGYLVICSYAIAILDFVSALLFACVSGALFFEYVSSCSMAKAKERWQVIIIIYI